MEELLFCLVILHAFAIVVLITIGVSLNRIAGKVNSVEVESADSQKNSYDDEEYTEDELPRW